MIWVLMFGPKWAKLLKNLVFKENSLLWSIS